MADEISPTVFTLAFSSFTFVGVGLVLYIIELPVDVLNTLFGAFAVALVVTTVEFFVVKNAIGQQQ